VQHALLAGGGSSDGGPGADVEPGCVGISWSAFGERFRGTKARVKSKTSQVISAHSHPPLLATGAHSIGFRMVVCCLCIDLT
jgi:hypothetical protein